MKWMKFRVKTLTAAEDILISSLWDIGLEGAQIEDHVPLTALEKEQMFVDILPESDVDDGIAYLDFFVEKEDDGSLIVNEQKTDKETLLAQMKQVLADTRLYCDIGEGSVAVDETEDIDWVNNWKEFFHQFYIDDLLIVPSWEEVKAEDKDKMILHIDPGTAFGTGAHETTKLCVRQIRKYVTPETDLLDVGTGSGILGIIALMAGARSAVGTDLDPCALEAAEENKAANNIEKDAFPVFLGNIITEEPLQEQLGLGHFSMAAANILADVLLPLTPVVWKMLAPGGIYITSGILTGREDDVARAMQQAGFDILEINYEGEWAAVTARKP